MVSPSYKAAYAIGSPNPSVLTHAPSALRGRAGYSPKTAGFYPNEPAGISLQTTLLHGSGPETQQIKPTHFIKVINNGFAFLQRRKGVKLAVIGQFRVFEVVTGLLIA